MRYMRITDQDSFMNQDRQTLNYLSEEQVMKSKMMLSEHKMKMATEIPPHILTPDTVETRIGTLHFFGIPDEATADGTTTRLSAAVQAFLTCLPAADLYALRGRRALAG
jgi:hypothetical protein